MPREATFDEHPLGLSWTVEETMARSSHALVDSGRVWLIDPVEVDDAVDRGAALGTPVAVLQLLDRHNRDCEAVAARLGIPHVKVPDVVPDSPFDVIRAVRTPGWRESALWWPERRALVVAEVVGRNRLYSAGRDGAGMHPVLRALPPRTVRAYEPEHLLFGHGAGFHGPVAASELETAHARARRDIPRMLAAIPLAVRG